MKKKLNYFLVAFAVFSFIACSNDDDDKDEIKPSISINYDGGFPKACDELVRGETYQFKAYATDNAELASYSIDLHNNFEHHTHDDDDHPTECEPDAEKEPVNPFSFMQNYDFPKGQTGYEIIISIAIPSDADTGDYHCTFSVTDATGWQNRASVDFKIVD